MSKRVSEEGRMVDWFAQADLAAARTMLAVLTKQVSARVQAERPADQPNPQRKRGRPAKVNGPASVESHLGAVE